MLRRLPVVSILMAALALTSAAAARAGEEPQPLPAWRQAAQEIDHPTGFMRVYINDIDTLWNEFSRSQLFRALAQDKAVAASTTKMIAEVDKRKQTFGKAIGKDDPDWIVAQLGKLGPFAIGLSMPNGSSTPQSKLIIRHGCDADFVQLALNALGNSRTLHLERLTIGDFEMPQAPYAYRLNGGETILTLSSGGPNLYSNGRRFLIASQKTSESALIQQAAKVGVPTEREQAFAAFLGKNNRWLSAAEIDYPALMARMTGEIGMLPNDLQAILGVLSVVFEKETVNKSNRFEVEAKYPGEELNKGILFFGAGQPLNPEVAQIFPDELVLAMHANYDMKRFLALNPADLQNTSTQFRQGLTEMQAAVRKLVTAAPGDGQPAIAGPVLTTGMSLLMLEPDRIEEFFNSFVFAFGIEPGYKLTEAWIKALPMTKNWDGTAKAAKLIQYNDTDIGVIGEGRDLACITVAHGVLLVGSNLKQVKRVVRYLNQVKKGETDPRKSNEWQHVNAMVGQGGGGALHAFGVMKMDYLLKVLVPTGLGAGMMFLPDLPTDVDWNAVAGRLQPATGVVLYDPQQGLKAHLVSDLPLGTLIAAVSVAQSIYLTGDDRFFWGGQDDPDDLPPVGGRAGGVDGFDGGLMEPDDRVEPMPPEEVQPVEEPEAAEPAAP